MRRPVQGIGKEINSNIFMHDDVIRTSFNYSVSALHKGTQKSEICSTNEGWIGWDPSYFCWFCVGSWVEERVRRLEGRKEGVGLVIQKGIARLLRKAGKHAEKKKDKILVVLSSSSVQVQYLQIEGFVFICLLAGLQEIEGPKKGLSISPNLQNLVLVRSRMKSTVTSKALFGPLNAWIQAKASPSGWILRRFWSTGSLPSSLPRWSSRCRCRRRVLYVNFPSENERMTQSTSFGRLEIGCWVHDQILSISKTRAREGFGK